MKKPPYTITGWTAERQRWVRAYTQQRVYLVTGPFVDRFGDVEPLVSVSHIPLVTAPTVYVYEAVSFGGILFIQDDPYGVMYGHQLTRLAGGGEPVDGIPWCVHTLTDLDARAAAIAEFIKADL